MPDGPSALTRRRDFQAIRETSEILYGCIFAGDADTGFPLVIGTFMPTAEANQHPGNPFMVQNEEWTQTDGGLIFTRLPQPLLRSLHHRRGYYDRKAEDDRRRGYGGGNVSVRQGQAEVDTGK